MFRAIIVLSLFFTDVAQTQHLLALPPLPYALNALEPVLSERLMQLHHGKHHQAYTDKANIALKAIAADEKLDTQMKNLANQPIEIILTQLQTVPEQYRLALRNNGGGYVNHQLFFSMLRSPTATAAENNPSDALLRAIEQSFGSFEKFREAFTMTSLNIFGSGWVWLYIDGSSKTLVLNSTANQDNPIMFDPSHIVVLGIDLWEHAYYLVYENRRNEYVENFWRLVNWPFVERLYEGGSAQRVDL